MEHSEFVKFAEAVSQKFKRMDANSLFRTSISGDTLYETYLKAFPEGTNPIFRQRAEHDCSTCKQFIRAVGNVVSIDASGSIVSIWDNTYPHPYDVVARQLSALVKTGNIVDAFMHTERSVGTINSFDHTTGAKWSHLYADVPRQCLVKAVDLGTRLNEARTGQQVFLRALTEITDDAIVTVLDLIDRNELYRGAEFKKLVQDFSAEKLAAQTFGASPSIFAWQRSTRIHGGVLRIYGSVIGTLLVDLSENTPIERAVASFESKMAPTNYRRPTPVISTSMIRQAQETIEKLGLSDALARRYATDTDVSTKDVIFVDRSSGLTSVFDDLHKEVSHKVPTKVQEVSVAEFLTNVLPGTTTLEVLFQNEHVPNLVSLTAGTHDAPSLFSWGNTIAWSYNGGVADSMRERVKQAGGKVDGVLRCSLSWENVDDLDIHVIEPQGTHIFYGAKRSSTHGCLDVDMNAGGIIRTDPVENITWPHLKLIQHGEYQLYVHNYHKRSQERPGFAVEVEYLGETHEFTYAEPMANGERVNVARFRIEGTGITISSSLTSQQRDKEVWNCRTNRFHKVRKLLKSPNRWDTAVGNEHLFFILDGCRNPESCRGFYNEFLRSDLATHRKVFEILGNKMSAEPTDNQLSGLGFSSTQKNGVIVRTSGTRQRVVKVIF